jgi:hypothetical protein
MPDVPPMAVFEVFVDGPATVPCVSCLTSLALSVATTLEDTFSVCGQRVPHPRLFTFRSWPQDRSKGVRLHAASSPFRALAVRAWHTGRHRRR